MNMTTAIVTFIKQAEREQAIPFVISRNIPNEETIQAIKGVERLKKDPNRQTYSSFDELLKEVEADDSIPPQTLTTPNTYDRLNQTCGKEIFVMQIVSMKAYWHMGHAWLVNLLSTFLLHTHIRLCLA